MAEVTFTPVDEPVTFTPVDEVAPKAEAPKRSFLRDLFEPEISGGPLRVIPGVVGGALGGIPGASAGYGLGEYGAQKFQQATGQRKDVDPLQIGLATALPGLAAGAGRLVRGLGRTATRWIPSRFEAAQRTAREGADEVVGKLRPDVEAGSLFRAARQAGGDAVPTQNIQRAVRDLGQTVGDSPTNPGLKLVKEYADKLGALSQTGQVDLQSLMQMRLDLGRSLGKAPELGALYGAIIKDLESAAKAGGPGAANVTSALSAFKANLGADKFAAMVESATSDTVAGGQKALNIATLGKAVRKNSPELTKLLGPEKMAQVQGYLDQYKGLPPAQAYTFFNMVGSMLAAGAGAVVGGVSAAPALLGAGAFEIGRNAAMVGRNPQWLNQMLGATTGTLRAGTQSALEKK